MQKSTSAKSFEGVGFVDGKNSSETQSVYEFTDKDVLPGLMYYYRLKQKDVRGETSVSKIIVVRAGADVQEEAFFIQPNPNRGTFILSGQDLDKADIHLYTPSGAEIPIQTAEKESHQKLDISAKTFLPPGIYFLNINAPDRTKATKMKVFIIN